ncbi:MAG: ubiquitin-like protein Pup [Acidimicrobiales bacterium]|nr:ubiquitin-like protein Pup [Acidimicrobiales bacterium]
MTERELKKKHVEKKDTQTTTEQTSEAPVNTERTDKLKAEMDDLLDEIDEVLEDNAEEFVRNYVQKGGQ